MTHLQVLLVSTITWVAWFPTIVLEYRARNDPGSISIFPAPFMPFVFWGLAYVFHRAHLQAGVTAMGVLHLPFLAWMIGSMALSGWIIYREGKAVSKRRQDGKG
ncbi:hypothetical protein PV762_04610 [Mitsuaria sp. CC2]|uniref:hypothetical protein n=1 Tax=Mitsuaria sp. CC2 TaxID=3029186 RepID=UPI003B8BC2C7